MTKIKLGEIKSKMNISRSTIVYTYPLRVLLVAHSEVVLLDASVPVCTVGRVVLHRSGGAVARVQLEILHVSMVCTCTACISPHE